MFNLGQSIEIESGPVTRGGEGQTWREMRCDLLWLRDSSGSTKNHWELHTVHLWIVWCMNCISMKLLFSKTKNKPIFLNEGEIKMFTDKYKAVFLSSNESWENWPVADMHYRNDKGVLQAEGKWFQMKTQICTKKWTAGDDSYVGKRLLSSRFSMFLKCKWLLKQGKKNKNALWHL